MTETVAIQKYLADKYKPELLGTTAEERAHVNMLSGVIDALKESITGHIYRTGDKEGIAL